MKNLFEKFQENELKNINACRGGERTSTTSSGANAGPDGCTSDSVDISQTQVAGQPEGTTTTDRTDWQWECGVSVDGTTSTQTSTRSLATL